MRASILAASLGVIVAGPIGGLVGGLAPVAWRRLRTPKEAETPITLVLLVLLIALRSGLSVLAALIEVSDSMPSYRSLRSVARLATVSGLVGAIPYADDRLRPVVSQLARSQHSGASLSGVVRGMLEAELATERSRRIARARALPVRLMIPVTLLMLPGLILLLYAPSLLAMFEDLTGAF